MRKNGWLGFGEKMFVGLASKIKKIRKIDTVTPILDFVESNKPLS